MNKAELKTILLDLDIFDDNEYLDLYCSLIIDNLETKKEKFVTQRHHVIPVCFYIQKYSCKDRQEALPYADQDPNNLTVNLIFKDHILAHYYLSLASINSKNVRLAYSFTHIFFSMLIRDSNYHIKLDKNYILQSLEEIDLNKYQKLYEFRRQEQSNNGFTQKGRKHTAEWCKKHSEAMKGRVTYERTSEIKTKISNTLKQGNIEGKYVLSDEGRERKRHLGKENGRYGKPKKWITNGYESRLIDPEDEIPEGWYKGTAKYAQPYPIVKYSMQGIPEAYFPTIYTALDSIGCTDKGYMRMACDGRQQSYKSHQWRYYPDLIDDTLIELVTINKLDEAAEYIEQKYHEKYKNMSIDSIVELIPVVQFDLDGNKIAEFDDIKEACRQTNQTRSSIILCCEGIYTYSHGFIWRYHNNEEEFLKNPRSTIGKNSPYFA